MNVRAILDRKKMFHLKFREMERPIVVSEVFALLKPQAQLFGNQPKYFYDAAQIVKEMGFDGIDINFGCPEHKICYSGLKFNISY